MHTYFVCIILILWILEFHGKRPKSAQQDDSTNQAQGGRGEQSQYDGGKGGGNRGRGGRGGRGRPQSKLQYSVIYSIRNWTW